ncbi:MAG: hypothetical protein NZ739_08880 [Verrucomicrobiae bacterium]|nr:hypothetical protein [Verrucomicrobiae bacterium]
MFKLNTDGTGFQVVKHFTGCDGAHPDSELVLCGGALYGTTTRGGAWDLGTVFRISLAPEPIHLVVQLLGNSVVLSWTNSACTLQAGPAPAGPFTNVPGATSPYTVSPVAPQLFFRLARE